MKIFEKIKKQNGRRHIYFCGIKILSYKKRKKISKYDLIYARRFDGLTDKEIRFCLEQQFKERTGYSLNLDNPKTFNEKLQWLKLYYHRHPTPLLTQCADKIGVREYIKEKIGEEYLVPCLGIWDSPDEIDFDKLPSRFVLKVNWGSGQNIIVKDKSKLDIPETIAKLSEWMKQTSNHYYNHFEWPYKNIQPKIIAEKYIEQMDGNLLDYKIMCYNGIPKNLLVCSDRATNLKKTFFDVNWKRLPFKRLSLVSSEKIEKPSTLDKMLEISKVLSKPFPFSRVDLFCINEKLYVGEITFFPGAGQEKFDPFEWDLKLGNLLTLPKEKNENIKNS